MPYHSITVDRPDEGFRWRNRPESSQQETKDATNHWESRSVHLRPIVAPASFTWLVNEQRMLNPGGQGLNQKNRYYHVPVATWVFHTSHQQNMWGITPRKKGRKRCWRQRVEGTDLSLVTWSQYVYEDIGFHNAVGIISHGRYVETDLS